MKIVKLKAENIKRLVAVEITPKGDVVKITGKNAAGKTSVLDAIWWALKGRAIQGEPVRKGEESGSIELDLGELSVERRFNQSGTNTLIVANKEGARFTSPQTVLDQLVGDISFDPLQFAREKPREQYETLSSIAGLGDKLEKLETTERAKFADRTDINRQIKHNEGALSKYAELPDETPDEPGLGDLLAELETGRRRNAKIDEAEVSVRFAQHAVSRLERELAEAKAAAADSVAALEKLGERVDVRPLRDKVDAAEADIAIRSDCQHRDGLRDELAKLKAQSTRLSAAIDKCREERKKLLAKAKFPVKGLSLEAGQVLYNGIPFDQASSAEQLRVSMAVAMHANPKLRVIRLNNASLLDSAGMKIIEEMAAADDFQVWLEVVDESRKVGIVIEDGQVAADNQIDE